MYKREIIATSTIIFVLTILIIGAIPRGSYNDPPIISRPKEQAQFILSSWDYPDEYGQGIVLMHFYENSTGSWQTAWVYIYLEGYGYRPFNTFWYYTDDYFINWSAGAAMKIRVQTTFNQTLVGVSSASEGQNYHRHSVTVSSAGNEIFSQQNFTYYDVIEYGEENYYYKYEVILDFLPVEGGIYTVVIDYEIYY